MFIVPDGRITTILIMAGSLLKMPPSKNYNRLAELFLLKQAPHFGRQTRLPIQF